METIEKIGKLDPLKKSGMAIVAGGVNEFYTQYLKFKETNIIEKEFISSQMIQIPNPEYLKGISVNKPETVMSVFITAVIFGKQKEK